LDCEQRGFEARLVQRLEAADLALRQQLEASVLRLEAKLDSIASNAGECFSATHEQQLPTPPLSRALHRLGQRSGIEGDSFETKGVSLGTSHEGQQEQDRFKSNLEKRLDRIAIAVGVKPAGEEDDDRKRMKEKLKLAIERDKRSHIRKIVSEQAKWLEYIFGICKADQRCGKRGSRYIDCFGIIVVFLS
jgi:hypothetical protein